MRDIRTLALTGLLIMAAVATMLLVSTPAVVADTPPSQLSGDVTWATGTGPYYLERDLHIPFGSNLTIEEGVHVYINGYYGIYVDGNLTINGTGSNRVVITSNQTSPSWSDWWGIRVNSTGNLLCMNASISYGDYGLYLDGSDDAIINDTVFWENGYFACYPQSADNVWIKGCYFYRNYYGLYPQNCEFMNVTNCTFYDNSKAFYLYRCDYGNITHNDFTYNDWGYPLEIYDSDHTIVDSNVFRGQGTQILTNAVMLNQARWTTFTNNNLNDTAGHAVNFQVHDRTHANMTMWYNNWARNLEMKYVRGADGYDYSENGTYYLALYDCNNTVIHDSALTEYGIYVFYSDNTVIRDVNFTDCGHAIAGTHDDNGIDKNFTIRNVEFYSGNGIDIYLRYFDGVKILGLDGYQAEGLSFEYCDDLYLNDVYVAYDSRPVILYHCEHAVLHSVKVYQNPSSDCRGIEIQGWSFDTFDHVIASNCTVDGKEAVYIRDATSTPVMPTSYYLVGVFNSSNIHLSGYDATHRMLPVIAHSDESSFTGFTAENLEYQMNLYYSYGINLTSWNISYTYEYPFRAYYCDWLNVTDCDLYLTDYVTLDHCKYGNFSNNRMVSRNYYYGLYMSLSDENVVQNSTFSRCSRGIYMSNSDDNLIIGNTISASNYAGMYLSSCYDNNITMNRIDSSANYGMYLTSSHYTNISSNFVNDTGSDYAMYLESSQWSTIWDNGFIGYPTGAYDDNDNNHWDNGSWGNLWSDYTGSDLDFNGIGDTPYVIDGDSQDDYPLMDPWGPTLTVVPANNSFIWPGTPITVYVTDFNLNTAEVYNTTSGGWDSFTDSYVVDTTGWSEGTHTVQARADDLVGNVVSTDFYFKVDSIAPMITITSPGNNTFLSSVINITFDVADVNLDEVYVSIDGSIPMLMTAPYNVSTMGWSEGVHYVAIGAFDGAGNGITKSFVFTVDLTDPVIERISPNGTEINVGNLIDMRITDMNLDTVQYSVDGGLLVDLAAPFDISTDSLTAGSHDFYIIAIDKAGNSADTNFSLNVSDLTKPQIILLSPEVNAAILPGTIIQLSITDNDLQDTSYSLDGGASQVFSGGFNVDTSSWQEGKRVLRVEASDGNNNVAIGTFTFYIDATPPTVELLSPADGSVIRAGTLVKFNVLDVGGLADMSYSLGGVFWQKMPGGSVLSTETWPEGTNTVWVKAVDKAGNEAEVTFAFDVDNTPPQIMKVYPMGPKMKLGDDIIVTITDAHSFTASWMLPGAPNSTAMTAGTDGNFTIPTTGMSEGEVVVIVEAFDAAGIMAHKEIHVMLDGTGPKVVEYLPPYNATFVKTNAAVVVDFDSAITVDSGDVFTTPAKSVTTSYTGHRLTIVADGGWDADTTYTITIGDVKDDVGNAMADDFELMFTTGSGAEGDQDGDKLPDDWEREHGLDPTVDDSAEDADGDGLTNAEEYAEGTDPNKGDTDGDGMPDKWELDNDLNPLSAVDGTQDMDDDGHTNSQEFAAGTDPKKKSDSPAPPPPTPDEESHARGSLESFWFLAIFVALAAVLIAAVVLIALKMTRTMPEREADDPPFFWEEGYEEEDFEEEYEEEEFEEPEPEIEEPELPPEEEPELEPMEEAPEEPLPELDEEPVQELEPEKPAPPPPKKKPPVKAPKEPEEEVWETGGDE